MASQNPKKSLKVIFTFHFYQLIAMEKRWSVVNFRRAYIKVLLVTKLIFNLDKELG